MDAQLKKGVLELCLLADVAKQDQYGYDIIRKMQSYFPDMGESAFYAILRRLNREGALEQYAGKESGGPPRKYYRITGTGREKLEEKIADWQKLVEILGELGIQ